MDKIIKPKLKPGEWVSIGESYPYTDAVVCQVYGDRYQLGGDAEVVYLDYQKRAINTNIVWEQGHWSFKNDAPSGGYADDKSRLSDFVRILHIGQDFKV